MKSLKRKSPDKPPYISGLAEICAIGVMVAAFITGTVVVQYLFAYPDMINIKQCLPWFVIFTFGTMYFNSVFDLTRRAHHIAFSAFISIILVNVFMMALPFFEMLYFIKLPTLFADIFLECVGMAVWIGFFHHYWLRCHPPVSTVVFCDDIKYGKELARKINRYSQTNRVDAVISYETENFYSVIDCFNTLVLVKPPAEKRNEIALECWNKKKELMIIPDVYELIINNATFVQFDDVMSYRIKSLGLNINQRITKRLIDLIGASLALILLSPLMLIISLIIKRDGGPVFFSQGRVTRDNRVFRLYKFRTMVQDAEKYTGPVLALKDDPRITKAGKWLRQTRLDEIPQFWNVLRGDMSLVGPRPEREHFIDLYVESLPEFQYRTRVRAGITGLAHVRGKYNTTPEERIKLDLTYIQNYSIALDLKIIIETIRVVFTKEFAEGIDQTDKNEDVTERLKETI